MVYETDNEPIQSAKVRIHWADSDKPFDTLRQTVESAGAHWKKESLVSIPSSGEEARIDVILEAHGSAALYEARREMEKLTKVESFALESQGHDAVVPGQTSFHNKPQGPRRFNRRF